MPPEHKHKKQKMVVISFLRESTGTTVDVTYKGKTEQAALEMGRQEFPGWLSAVVESTY